MCDIHTEVINMLLGLPDLHEVSTAVSLAWFGVGGDTISSTGGQCPESGEYSTATRYTLFWTLHFSTIKICTCLPLVACRNSSFLHQLHFPIWISTTIMVCGCGTTWNSWPHSRSTSHPGPSYSPPPSPLPPATRANFHHLKYRQQLGDKGWGYTNFLPFHIDKNFGGG